MLNQELARKKIVELREKYGVSYSFMARKANINDSTFRKFVYGYRSISE